MSELTVLMAATLLGTLLMFTTLAGGLAGLVDRAFDGIPGMTQADDFSAKFIRP